MARYRWLATRAALLGCVMLLAGFGDAPTSGRVQDEARSAGRAPESFPMADEDYFHDMDGGLELTADEVKGRNMWLVWTGGNDRFWDGMTSIHLRRLRPAEDHLPRIPSMKIQPRQSLELSRAGQRALLRQGRPGPIRSASACGSKRARRTARPIRSRTRRNIRASRSARAARRVPVGSYYGYATGIVGLRLFPNPDFDERGEEDVGRRALLHRSRLLQRRRTWCGPTASACPAASAMSGPSPINPPADPGEPAMGQSQLHGRRAVLLGRPDLHLERAIRTNYMFQLVHTSRPGALDTSLVSTDNINNPRTMNAIYNLGARLEHGASAGARRSWPAASSTTSSSTTSSPSGPLTEFFEQAEHRPGRRTC